MSDADKAKAEAERKAEEERKKREEQARKQARKVEGTKPIVFNDPDA